jgi:anti-sigma-K factor RskA
MNNGTPLSDDELDALAGEFVLGTLPAAQRREVQVRMESDLRLAQAVDAWNERLLPFAAIAEPIAPPPRLWRRLEDTLGLAKPDAATRWWARLWDNTPLWRALAAGGMAATVLMAVLLAGRPDAGQPKFMVVLVAPQDKAPGWVIQASDNKQMSLIPLGTFEVPQDKALQFWTKAEGWNAPVSLGLVKPGQRINVPINALPALTSNQLFELTLEPPAGSPTGRPTGPIQFIGRAVPVL